jgi:hypothetical protein
MSSPYRSNPDAAVTDADRTELNARLNTAFESGALDAEDYQHRLDQLFAAQRMGELAAVAEGLPPLQTYAIPAIVEGAPAGIPGQLAPAAAGTRLAVVAGGVVVGVALLVALLLVLLL